MAFISVLYTERQKGMQNSKKCAQTCTNWFTFIGSIVTFKIKFSCHLFSR